MDEDEAFRVAACTVQLSVIAGMRFRQGVTKAAAIAVIGRYGEVAVEAMSRTLQAYEVPRVKPLFG